MAQAAAASAKSTATGHTSFLHDAQIDPTARYMLTCSSDRTVRLFSRASAREQEESGSTWTPVGHVRDHAGQVMKVAWAHPVFGVMFASAAVDRVVFVYKVEGSSIVRVSRLSVCQTDAVLDIAFAPRQFGTLLGAACGDGYVRIIDVSSQRQPMRVAVDEVAADPAALADSGAPPRRSAVLTIAWLPSILETMMVFAAGTAAGSVAISAFDPARKRFVVVRLLDDATGRPLRLAHGTSVTSLAWAPAVGRRFQLLAVCSQRLLQVVYIRKAPQTDTEGTSANANATGAAGLTYRCRVVTLDQSDKALQRVAWDRTATILGTIGRDQHVGMWQRVSNAVDPEKDTWELI